jgi:hypothetical protein
VGTPPMSAVTENWALAIPGALKARILAIEIDRYFFMEYSQVFNVVELI